MLQLLVAMCGLAALGLQSVRSILGCAGYSSLHLDACEGCSAILVQQSQLLLLRSFLSGLHALTVPSRKYMPHCSVLLNEACQHYIRDDGKMNWKAWHLLPQLALFVGIVCCLMWARANRVLHMINYLMTGDWGSELYVLSFTAESLCTPALSIYVYAAPACLQNRGMAALHWGLMTCLVALSLTQSLLWIHGMIAVASTGGLGGVKWCIFSLICESFSICQVFRTLRKMHSLVTTTEAATADNGFASKMANTRRKFEILYCLVEVSTFIPFAMAYLRGNFETNGRQQIYLTTYTSSLSAVMLRMYRCAGQQAFECTDGVSLLLDVLNFTVYAASSGYLQGEPGALPSLMMKSFLFYRILLVLRLHHAIFLALCCLAGFGAGLAAAGPPWQAQMALPLAASILCLGAKRILENTQSEAFSLQQETAETLLQERLLRCKAEFELEAGTSSERNKLLEAEASCGHALNQPVKYGKTVEETSVAGSSESRHTAPPVLLSTKADTDRVRCDPDCLPTGTLVWVEGHQLPQPVERLTAGQRILCFDRLIGNMKYAELLDREEANTPTEWVQVTLADGSKLQVTSDHPLRPEGNAQPRPPKPASSLEVGESLKVLTMTTVPVASVMTSEMEASRISLTVQQPERHSIFAAAPGQGSSIHALAVESANAFDSTTYHIRSHNTFITAAAMETYEMSHGEAPRSAPPSLAGEPSSSDVTSPGKHPETCRPCAHEHNFQTGRAPNPCVKGASCNFCHAEHDGLRKARAEVRRSRKKHAKQKQNPSE